jgi:hypothetical protein
MKRRERNERREGMREKEGMRKEEERRKKKEEERRLARKREKKAKKKKKIIFKSKGEEKKKKKGGIIFSLYFKIGSKSCTDQQQETHRSDPRYSFLNIARRRNAFHPNSNSDHHIRTRPSQCRFHDGSKTLLVFLSCRRQELDVAVAVELFSFSSLAPPRSCRS